MKQLLHLLFFLLLIPSALSSQSIVKDSSWATHGDYLTSAFTGGNFEMARQSTGRLLVGLNKIVGFNSVPALVRFTVDGRIDSTFGTNGEIDNAGVHISVQPDDKIIAAYGSAASSYITVRRYSADGILDTSFNNHIYLYLDNHYYNYNTGTFQTISSVALQPDGKVIVGGTTSLYQGAGSSTSGFAVMRLTATGLVDSTFGTNGSVVLYLDSFYDSYVRKVLVQADGKVLAVGDNADGFGSGDIKILRFTAAGSYDGGWGTNGIVNTDFGNGTGDLVNDAKLQRDGKLVLALAATVYPGAAATNAINLIRYNTDGTVHATFAHNGRVNSNYDSLFKTASALAIQPDGKIITGGVETEADNTTSFILSRFSIDGTPDAGFGASYKVKETYNNPNNAFSAMLLTPDAKLYTGGISDSLTRYIAVSRYDLKNITALADVAADFSLMVYPSPSDRSCHIRGIDLIAGDAIDIIDMDGRLIVRHMINAPMAEIGVSTVDIAPGIYLVQIHTADSFITRRIGVQH